MSKYDNASLVQIPSGYKAGTLYSVLPANGDGDFDFTRASIATRVNSQGLIETVASGVPRLDYPILNGVVQSCPALLLEPARTNLVTYSEDFTQWVNTGSETTDTANQSISPDGSNNATKLQEANSSFGFHRLTASVTASSLTNYSLSCFVKKGNLNFIQIILVNTGDSESVSKVFDVESGLVGQTIINGTGTLSGSKIEDYGNGWFKCTIVAQLPSAPNSFRINLANSLNNNTTSLGMVQYTGDGNGYVYIYGAQLEAGSYATSYIPTSGTTVARAAEVCNGAGTASDFNDSEGVLFAEIENIDGFLSISDGTANNRITIGRESGQTKRLFLTQSGGTIQTYSNSTDWSVNALDKVLISYKLNDVKIYVNGFLIAIDTSYSLPSSLNQLSLTSGAGSSNFYGKTKQLIAFDAALTDEQLEDLTSWDSFAEMATEQLYTIE